MAGNIVKNWRLNRKTWIIISTIVVLGLVLGLVFLRSGSDPDEQADTNQTPAEVDPDERNPDTSPGVVTITSSPSAAITIVRLNPFDLGQTPTSFKVDQPSTWNIIAISADTGHQQELIKDFEPDQAETIHFELIGSQPWSRPTANRGKFLTQPDAGPDGSILGINPQNKRLQRLSAAGELTDLANEQVESVIWQNPQSYLYRTSGNSLVFVSPTGGWRVEGVLALSGGKHQAAWLERGGQVWLFDWSDEPRTAIHKPEAIGVFLGPKSLYLFEWGEPLDTGDILTHPPGSIEIYGLDDLRPVGQASILSYPQALAEVGGYSFWGVEDGVEIINNQDASNYYGRVFSRLVVDLKPGVDSLGQPIVYLLTANGEIWDFSPQRGTYNLVGVAPPDGYGGLAVASSLVQTPDGLYFGFEWQDSNLPPQTYRVELKDSS